MMMTSHGEWAENNRLAESLGWDCMRDYGGASWSYFRGFSVVWAARGISGGWIRATNMGRYTDPVRCSTLDRALRLNIPTTRGYIYEKADPVIHPGRDADKRGNNHPIQRGDG